MNELRLRLSGHVEGHFAASGSHLSSGYFTLNPALFVKCVLADGRPADYCVRQEKEGYQTVTFSAPDCRTLTVEYEGVLDGTTGRYPYVKEKTSDRCYILRSETLYYPVFALPDSTEYWQNLLSPQEENRFQVTVEVLGGRRSCTNLQEISNGVYEGHNPTIAVGDYRLEKCPFGTIAYFSMELDKLAEIRRTAAYTNDFMNRYKTAEIRNYQIVEIPAGLGSFVLPGTLFLAGELDTRQMIHEFIHTNWNPRCSGTVQRSRFFDEGVTEYFTAKVLACYGLQDVKTSRALWEAQYRSAIEAHPEWKVPIADYGARELGDLSYSYGPLALFALEDAVGETEMKRIMSELLERYQQEDVDFQKLAALFPAGATPIFQSYFYT